MPKKFSKLLKGVNFLSSLKSLSISTNFDYKYKTEAEDYERMLLIIKWPEDGYAHRNFLTGPLIISARKRSLSFQTSKYMFESNLAEYRLMISMVKQYGEYATGGDEAAQWLTIAG